MGCRIRNLFSWLLWLGALMLVMLAGLGLLRPPGAMAAIRQLEEAPGQTVYQSRQTLKDQHGHSWQAIAFKRTCPNGESSFDLRLVGFPGIVAIDRSQPLALTNSLGQTLTAANDSSNLFTTTARPEPHVGQYDLEPLLSQLQPGIPLQITVPTLRGEAISLPVAPALIKEWQTLANFG